MLSQQGISPATPLGATLVPGGASFRLWAPEARAVYLDGVFGGQALPDQAPERLLGRDPAGFWGGFLAGAADGDRYRFWVDGAGSSGHKRDPYARELDPTGFPDCFGIVRPANAFPWHDAGFVAPDFADLVIYQLHLGTFAVERPGLASNLLDVALRVPYLAELGINMLQPLPIDEQENHPGMGYGGADIFSPDFPCVAREGLTDYLARINRLYAARRAGPIALHDLASGPGQLKVLVDLCHLHGIAVAFDVVYNHAGGFSVDGRFDDNALYYLDRRPQRGDNNDSLYFTDQDRGTGGLAFALWNAPVAQYLVDNALHWVDECHVDGFRYDEVSALISTGQGSGWTFCRQLTSTLRARQPRLLQNAEFWPGEFGDIPTSAQPVVSAAAAGGMGFDVVQHDALRGALRGAVGAAAAGAQAAVSMAGIAAVLYPPGFDHAWRAVTCIENHDLVYVNRQPRVPALADGSDHRSWYARSRTRVATAVLLTAPGIPQLFMGQEFAQDKPWDENPGGANLLDWAGLRDPADPTLADHRRCCRDLVHLRGACPALRGDAIRAFWVSDSERILAFHRWVEGRGEDVLVVVSLAESTRTGYRLGFPFAGAWVERFNSDAYDHWPNPWVAGNGGAVWADALPLHGFAASAALVIPANGVLVFTRA